MSKGYFGFDKWILIRMVKFGHIPIVEFIRQLSRGQIPTTFYFRPLSKTKISSLECCRFGKIPEVTFQAIETLAQIQFTQQ